MTIFIEQLACNVELVCCKEVVCFSAVNLITGIDTIQLLYILLCLVLRHLINVAEDKTR